MTKEEALKLALEVLERYQVKRQDFDTFAEASAFIKEALAQDEQSSSQEPVAWMHEWEDGELIPLLHHRGYRLNDQPKSVRPLVYGDTTPPKRQPLTAAQRVSIIDAAADFDFGDGFNGNVVNIIDMVEAAHGIKETEK